MATIAHIPSDVVGSSKPYPYIPLPVGLGVEPTESRAANSAELCLLFSARQQLRLFNLTLQRCIAQDTFCRYLCVFAKTITEYEFIAVTVEMAATTAMLLYQREPSYRKYRASSGREYLVWSLTLHCMLIKPIEPKTHIAPFSAK